MAGVNDNLLDRSVSHQVGLLRYGSGVLQDIFTLLDEAREELRAELEGRLARILERGFDTGPVTTKRVAAQLQQWGRLNSQIHAELGGLLKSELTELAAYELDFQERMLSGTLPITASWVRPGKEALVTAVTQQPFQGRFYGEHISDLAAAQFRAVTRTVQIGVANGRTLEQIMKSVIGSKQFNYWDGVTSNRGRRWQVETIVRTSVNHTATQTRELFYAENQDIVDGIQWISTLDARTTLICASLDGQVFEIGKGERPPAHYACRSTTAPVIKKIDQIPGFEDQAAEFRGSMDGQVPAKVTYPEWLKRQPVKVQDLALGVHRARLLRANPNLDIKQLGDAFRRPLSLGQLAVREAQLFENLSLEHLREIEAAIKTLPAKKKIQAIRAKRKAASREAAGKPQAELEPFTGTFKEFVEAKGIDFSTLRTSQERYPELLKEFETRKQLGSVVETTAEKLKRAKEWARANGAPVLAETNEQLAREIARKVGEWRKLQHQTGQMSDDLFRAHLREFDADKVAANWLKHLKDSTVGATDDALNLSVQQAINDNWRNPVFRSLMQSDVMPEERLVGFTKPVKSDFFSPEAAASRTADTTIFYDHRLAGWADQLDGFAPGKATSQSWGGPAASYRHEQAHSIWRVISPELREKFDDAFTAHSSTLKKDVTLYARKETEELFPELFAIITDPQYRRSAWADWVNDLGDELKDELSRIFKVSRSSLEFEDLGKAVTRKQAATVSIDIEETVKKASAKLANDPPSALVAVRDLDQATFALVNDAARQEYRSALQQAIAAGSPDPESVAQEALDKLVQGRAKESLDLAKKARATKEIERFRANAVPSGSLSEFLDDKLLGEMDDLIRTAVETGDTAAIRKASSEAQQKLIKVLGARSDAAQEAVDLAMSQVEESLKTQLGFKGRPGEPIPSLPADAINAAREAATAAARKAAREGADDAFAIADKAAKVATAKADEALEQVSQRWLGALRTQLDGLDDDVFQIGVRVKTNYFDPEIQKRALNLDRAIAEGTLKVEHKRELQERMLKYWEARGAEISKLDDAGIRQLMEQVTDVHPRVIRQLDEGFVREYLAPFNLAHKETLEKRLAAFIDEFSGTGTLSPETILVKAKELAETTGRKVASATAKRTTTLGDLQAKRKELDAAKLAAQDAVPAMDAQRVLDNSRRMLEHAEENLKKAHRRRKRKQFYIDYAERDLARATERVAAAQRQVDAIQGASLTAEQRALVNAVKKLDEELIALKKQLDEATAALAAAREEAKEAIFSLLPETGNGPLRLDFQSRVFTGVRRDDAEAAAAWLGRFLSGSDEVADITVKAAKSGRAFHTPYTNTISLDKTSGIGTALHEMMHMIEQNNVGISRLALGFLERRTKGEASRWLGRGYGRSEVTKADKFFNKYVGKQYPSTVGGRSPTEVLSMGVEYFWKDPFFLLKTDEEHFLLVLRLLLGDY